MEIFEQDFDLLFVKWIPREQNKEANQHAQQALYKLIKRTNKGAPTDIISIGAPLLSKKQIIFIF